MIYQSYVGFNQSLALPGHQFHNGRNASQFATGVAAVNLEVGTIAIRAASFEQGRLTIQAPSSGNIAFPAAGSFNYAGVVMENCNGRMSYASRTLIGTTTASTAQNFIPANAAITLGISGVFWVICEKAISPLNATVNLRFQNPVGAQQGIGYVTDTPDANTVIVPGASFYSADAVTLGIAKDPGLTAALDRARIGMANGFSVVPIQLRFGVANT